jgi:hypothetical protein
MAQFEVTWRDKDGKDHKETVEGRFEDEARQAVKKKIGDRGDVRGPKVMNVNRIRKDSLSMNVPGMAALADAVKALNDGVDCLGKRMDAMGSKRGDASREVHEFYATHAKKTAQKAIDGGDPKLAAKWVDYGTEHAKQAEEKAEKMEGPPEDKAKKDKSSRRADSVPETPPKSGSAGSSEKYAGEYGITYPGHGDKYYVTLKGNRIGTTSSRSEAIKLIGKNQDARAK